MLGQKHLSGLSYKYISYPEESHGSEPVKAIYDAMNWLYLNWYPGIEDSTAFQVKEHFSLLSAKYGYKIAPPEWFVAKRGVRILNNGRIDDAIAFFQLNAKNYPTSVEALMQLGDAFLKKNDKAKAIEWYKRAAELRPESKEIEQKIDSLIK
jgi:tetratricopeptide (TPR) repeat protein